jgi:hypothetical protein
MNMSPSYYRRKDALLNDFFGKERCETMIIKARFQGTLEELDVLMDILKKSPDVTVVYESDPYINRDRRYFRKYLDIQFKQGGREK